MLRTVAFVLCAATLASSQESAADQIERTITSLNDPARRSDAFAQESDGLSRYEELRASLPGSAFRILGPMESARPVLTISHEPWGEANILFPDPRHSGTVFVGPDVALSEALCVYQHPGELTRTIPLLFVLKREGATWKIASLRILAR
jgi:hypothetical protein